MGYSPLDMLGKLVRCDFYIGVLLLWSDFVDSKGSNLHGKGSSLQAGVLFPGRN